MDHMQKMHRQELKHRECLQQIKEQLDKANGKRRTRLLAADPDIERLLSMEGEILFDHGGLVPNSYGYDAITTSACAVTVRGVKWIRISAVTASPGSTGYGHLFRWNRHQDRYMFTLDKPPTAKQLREMGFVRYYDSLSVEQLMILQDWREEHGIETGRMATA